MNKHDRDNLIAGGVFWIAVIVLFVVFFEDMPT